MIHRKLIFIYIAAHKKNKIKRHQKATELCLLKKREIVKPQATQIPEGWVNNAPDYTGIKTQPKSHRNEKTAAQKQTAKQRLDCLIKKKVF